ncbi:MAG: hypothetical protein JWM15_1050 [Cryptosporangiaceae bacterium]|nr:hypothetical protein [Cryptosporangiaceae bacterium]
MTVLRRIAAGVLDPRFRAGLLVVVVVALLVLVAVTGLPSPARARAAVAGRPVLTVLGIAVLAVLLFPRAGVAAVAGVVFGPWPATGYVLTGTLLGAAAAFGVGRVLGREYLDRLTVRHGGTGRLARLDGWLGRRALLAVVTARLLPVVPFGLLNYAFGATRVRPGTFLAGTAVGILPSTFLYAVVGAAASDPTSPLFLGAAALTAVLAVGGALLVGRLSRRGADHTPR